MWLLYMYSEVWTGEADDFKDFKVSGGVRSFEAGQGYGNSYPIKPFR